MAELWAPIPGYEGSYEASDAGRIRSLDRVLMNPVPSGAVRRQTVRGRILQYRCGSGGYPYVNLSVAERGMKQKSWHVHRLVLWAFVGPRLPGMVSRHLNGNPTDNRLANLAYGTQSENMKDVVRHGRHKASNKTHCSRGHELTPENCNALKLEQGVRDCVLCQKVRNEQNAGRR